MNVIINAKQLRALLPSLVERVGKGARFTVLYRSRPAFQIIPMGEAVEPGGAIEEDSLYQATSVGRSKDNLSAADHDKMLYR